MTGVLLTHNRDLRRHFFSDHAIAAMLLLGTVSFERRIGAKASAISGWTCRKRQLDGLELPRRSRIGHHDRQT